MVWSSRSRPQANAGCSICPSRPARSTTTRHQKNKAIIKSAMDRYCSLLLSGKRAWACNTRSTIKGSQNVHRSLFHLASCLRGQLSTRSGCPPIGVAPGGMTRPNLNHAKARVSGPCFQPFARLWGYKCLGLSTRRGRCSWMDQTESARRRASNPSRCLVTHRLSNCEEAPETLRSE